MLNRKHIIHWTISWPLSSSYILSICLLSCGDTSRLPFWRSPVCSDDWTARTSLPPLLLFSDSATHSQNVFAVLIKWILPAFPLLLPVSCLFEAGLVLCSPGWLRLAMLARMSVNFWSSRFSTSQARELMCAPPCPVHVLLGSKLGLRGW